MAYAQQALSKYRPETLVVSVKAREKAKTIVIILLEHEQFAEEMKSLIAKKQNPNGSSILQLVFYWMKKYFIIAKTKIGKSYSDFDAKHPKMIYWKKSFNWLVLQNNHKNH